MSQALAKLYFREEVEQTDVDEAIKLMDFSIKSLNSDNKKVLRHTKNQDEMSNIINKTREIVQAQEGEKIDIDDIYKMLKKPSRMGAKLTKDKLTATLDHYANLKVIYVDDQERVYFI